MTPRRLVVTTNDHGRSVVTETVLVASFTGRPVDMHQLWLTTQMPPDPATDELLSAAPAEPLAQPPAFGSLFQVCTFAPGVESPMHRTSTIDYVVVLDGEIDIDPEEGPTVHLMTGDCLVQLATAHRWANRGPAPCSLAVVCLSTAADLQTPTEIEVVHD